MRHLRKEIKVLLFVLTAIYIIIGSGLATGTPDFGFKVVLTEIILIGLSFLNIYLLDVYD